MAILSDDEVKLRISAETTGEGAVEQLAKNIDALAKQGGEAAPALGVLANQVRKVATDSDTLNASVSKSTQSIDNQLAELKVLYAGWLSAQAAAGAVAGIAQTADAYANLTAKVKMAVGEGVALDEAFQGVEDIALRTNTSLEATGQLFAKLVETGKQMGFGQAEALRLTETVNQSIQLSGASRQQFVATKDYARLMRRLPDLLVPGGRALLCLNAPELDTAFLQDQMRTLAPGMVFEQRLPNPLAFADAEPERALKVLVYREPELRLPADPADGGSQ